VLIIEDNPANLELMSYILVAFGHSVHTATDGFSGIQAAITETPDLVVCDVQLPDILGFEVARQLRSEPELSSTPLVAVTALAMVGDRERILGAGFDGYLAKPIDPQTFLQEIESFLLPHFHHSVPWYSPGAVATPEPAPAEQSITVLAVDNLRVNLELARSILAPSGYRVLTAGSVSQGLARARDGRCDLILSDVSLSGESGYDLLIAVRADSQLRTIPFILITSTMMDEKDRKLGLALGADRFLRRPIEPEELLEEVRACLHQKDWC
jgi:two-component system cell cycle response regulator